MKTRLDGLRLQLLFFIILPFSLLLLVFAFAGVRIHQQGMRRLVAERDERAVRATAAAISAQLHHKESAIHGLALRLADGRSPRDVLDQADYLMEDFDEGLVVVDAKGGLIASMGLRGDWSAEPLQALLSGLQSQSPRFFEPLIDDEGNALVPVAAATEGELAVVGAFRVDSLLRSLVVVPSSSGSNFSAFLADSSGSPLANVGAAPDTEGRLAHAGVQAALRGETGSSYVPSEEGEHVVAYSVVLPTGWALIIEEPWESVLSPVMDLSLAAPLALAPALAVALIALWFGARRVIEPIRLLEGQAALLADGDPEAAEPVGGIAEIQHLQRTLLGMSRRIRVAQQALRRYIGAITRAQEDERKRLARDLHDETIQDLITLDQQIQMMSISLQSERPPAHEALEELHAAVQAAIKRVRRLSRGLRPIYLEDLGLVPALEMLARDAQMDENLAVSFRVTGAGRRLDSEVELAVYRMVQEMLSNIARHAQAANVSIEMIFSDDGVKVVVSDDGRGFEPPARLGDLAQEGHFGLIGIAERAELIQAELEIQSQVSRGTRITLHLPRSADASE